MKKLLFATIISMFFLFAFASCSAPAASEETGAQEQPTETATEKVAAEETVAEEEAEITGEKYLIGHNNIVKGNYSVDIVENCFTEACAALGVEPLVVNDEAKVENSSANIDNMIAAGVDGIVFLSMADTIFPVLAEKCNAAQVPFVIVDRIPTDEQLLQVLADSEYYVGGIGTSDQGAGSGLGQYAADNGYKKALIIAGDTANLSQVGRVNGFTEAFENGGGTVVDVAWGPFDMSAIMTRANDALIANPDIDCVYGTNGDIASISLEALEKHPEVSAKVFATDLDPDVLTGLSEDKIAAANGAHWVHVDFGLSMLVNYLEGKEVKDMEGQSPNFTIPLITLPSNLTDLYSQHWIETQPFSAVEVQSWTYPWNKEPSYELYKDTIEGYSAESRLEAKVAEGSLADSDLQAALQG